MKMTITGDELTVTVKAARNLSADEILHVHMLALGETTDLSEETLAPDLSIQGKSITPGSDAKPKRAEFVNGGRTLDNSLGDKLQEAMATARIPLGTKAKVLVRCPNCGKEQQKTTMNGNRFTTCPNCGQKLFNRPATDNWGELDEDGNLYLAYEEYTE